MFVAFANTKNFYRLNILQKLLLRMRKLGLLAVIGG
jgi:hypothetical protein